MRVYMIMPICFCSVVDTWAYLPVGIWISGMLKQHVENFRYLLLKCVNRWNVYYTHSLSLPYSLVYSVRILSP
nr:MAG TPA: hypothetical protein [Bacteriophage sp.]